MRMIAYAENGIKFPLNHFSVSYMRPLRIAITQICVLLLHTLVNGTYMQSRNLRS